MQIGELVCNLVTLRKDDNGDVIGALDSDNPLPDTKDFALAVVPGRGRADVGCRWQLMVSITSYQT